MSGSLHPDAVRLARDAAQRWGLPYLERPKKVGIDDWLETRAEVVAVYGATGWALRSRAGTLRFSLGMGELRAKRVAGGFVEDPLLTVGGVRRGDVVFDGTFGLGADTWVLAHIAGPHGQVTAVDTSVPLAFLGAESIRLRPPPGRAPIDVSAGESLARLRGLPSKSVDVVYFDPMFRTARRATPAFELLRTFAHHEPLTPEQLDEAFRVCRRRVVVKASGVFEWLAARGGVLTHVTRSTGIRWYVFDV